MNKKVIITLLVLAVIALLAGGGILVWSMKSGAPLAEPTPTPMITSTPTTEPTVGATAPAEGTKSDLEQIKEAFAEKYNKSLDEISLTVNKNTGTYASGGVMFSGEISGAWWLAYNGSSGWVIVADGNGTVLCADIEPYHFPVDMVPECWDEDQSKLIVR